MLRQEYFRRLVDAAPIELYLSGMDGARLYWPWRMLPPKSASQNYRDACERFIVDSDPQDDAVTTRDVLDTAERLGAEVASLADVYQDKEGTVDSLLHGLEVYDDHEFTGELLLPLQAPYVDCWRDLGEPRNHLLGIGGLKDARSRERITAARTLRDNAGGDVWIHGFGWGPTPEVANAIRSEPGLLDSLDYSTPMQGVDYSYQSGVESKSVAAMQAGTQLIEDLRLCTEYVDDAGHVQATL